MGGRPPPSQLESRPEEQQSHPPSLVAKAPAGHVPSGALWHQVGYTPRQQHFLDAKSKNKKMVKFSEILDANCSISSPKSEKNIVIRDKQNLANKSGNFTSIRDVIVQDALISKNGRPFKSFELENAEKQLLIGLHVNIGGIMRNVKVLVDTGAQADLIRFGFCRKFLGPSDNPINLLMVDGTPLKGGKSSIKICLNFEL